MSESHRINTSSKVFNKINEIKKILKKREASEILTEEILDFMFDQIDENLWDQFIEEQTPVSFKLKSYSDDPKFKESLEKLIQAHKKSSKKANLSTQANVADTE